MIAAVDTSGELLTVAVRRADGSWACGQRDARGQELLDLLWDVAGTEHLGEHSAFVCCVGPGSFTGTRVGLATIRGLAAGARAAGHTVDLHTVTSLQVRAHGMPTGTGQAEVACPAKRGELFVQTFTWRPDGMPVAHGDIRVVEIELAAPALVQQAARPVEADWLARAAADALTGAAVNAPLPLYVRAPDATPPGQAAR